MLHMVTASRMNAEAFAQSPLAQSARRLANCQTVRLNAFLENKLGLPLLYNRFLTEEHRDDLAVFVHDDLWLDDFFFADRIRAGLEAFDVIGLAGNRRLVPGAAAWHVKNEQMEWDAEWISGAVCHGKQPLGQPSIYGPTPAPVQLLDGVLLAVRVSKLLDAGVRFDERFSFHFYDLDFSRQANSASLKVGTWPIAVTHVSGGGYGSESWLQELAAYRAKWAG
jgi:hypothetical protein